MTTEDPDVFARRLAAESPADDDPTGWFDRLYTAAEQGETSVPWDRGAPHPLLVEWAEANDVAGPGRALVVGCGLGSDSEYVANLCFDTVACDVSPTAIESARRRHPDSGVRYETADVFDLPAGYRAAFDLVVESMTVQSLPVRVQTAATDSIASTVAPGGRLLVISAARDDGQPADGPPWPLTRSGVDRFATTGLTPFAVERLAVPSRTSAYRWRAEFHG